MVINTKKIVKFGYGMLLLGMTVSFSCASQSQQSSDIPVYDPNWESLKTHETPDWFKNDKFGIYFHWGVYSVPAFLTEWYPHYMYMKDYERWGKEVRPHHVKTYGENFQYHEFIPDFTAEHFDAEEWATLFKASGARYAGPVAEHHDHFSMWDSKVNPWNAARMGPKRDIVGELEKAIKGEGLKFVTTLHNARRGWYPIGNGLVDISTDELRDFYGETASPEKYKKTWKAKTFEVIDNYDPDMLWFDSKLGSIPEDERMNMVQHFYNKAAKNGQDVVLTYKKNNLPKGVAVLDIEGGRLNHLATYPWLTDMSFSYGSWCYTHNQSYKGANKVLDALIDIVSKNGCLLLNIGPRADGVIPGEIRTGLLEMGKWLSQYGEAVYDTNPFVAYGEGPTELVKNRFGGYDDKKEGYGPNDFRYTTNKKHLYIIQLDQPKHGQEYILKTFAQDSIASGVGLKHIELMGSDEKVKWEKKEDGLHISAPQHVPNDLALVYKAVMK